MWEAILPWDILEVISGFVFPMHKNRCLVHTFAKNTNYMRNEELLNPHDSPLTNISESSNLGAIMYLHEVGKLSKLDAISSRMFINACRNGNHDLIKYLTKTYRLTYDDAIYDNNGAYDEAFVHEQIEVLDYLQKTFGVTRSSKRKTRICHRSRNDFLCASFIAS